MTYSFCHFCYWFPKFFFYIHKVTWNQYEAASFRIHSWRTCSTFCSSLEHLLPFLNLYFCKWQDVLLGMFLLAVCRLMFLLEWLTWLTSFSLLDCWCCCNPRCFLNIVLHLSPTYFCDELSGVISLCWSGWPFDLVITLSGLLCNTL